VSLSPRERDVLIWTALGLKNSEVAEQLGISALTVRTHLDRSKTKLGAVNTVNAVVEAFRRREIRL
jgi:DNA-binding CsgD family transcriptional regulator